MFVEGKIRRTILGPSVTMSKSIAGERKEGGYFSQVHSFISVHPRTKMDAIGKKKFMLLLTCTNTRRERRVVGNNNHLMLYGHMI